MLTIALLHNNNNNNTDHLHGLHLPCAGHCSGFCVYGPTSSSLHHSSGHHYYSLLQLSKLEHQELHAQGPTAGKWHSQHLNSGSAVPVSMLIYSPEFRDRCVLLLFWELFLLPNPSQFQKD